MMCGKNYGSKFSEINIRSMNFMVTFENLWNPVKFLGNCEEPVEHR